MLFRSNYAMGLKISDSNHYKKIEKIGRSGGFEKGDSKISSIKNIAAASNIKNKNREMEEKIDVLLKSWGSIEWVFENISFEEIFELFLKELGRRNISNINAGKVRVIGLLESRGVAIENVIVVDFNDGIIPKISNSDMFLSSKIRERLNLIKIKDRERLQKHYYYSIFSKSKNIEVAYTKNEESNRSIMIDELKNMGLLNGQNFCEHENIEDRLSLFPNRREIKHAEDSFEGRFPDGFIFSSTSFTTLLSCKRRFYFRYILKLKEVDEDRGTNREIGIELHSLLRESYEEYIKKDSVDVADIKKRFYSLMDKKIEACDSYAQKTALSLSKYEMERYFDSEEERFRGSKIVIDSLEKSFLCDINGLAFSGKIDRIDMVDDAFVVIDYKYKNDVRADGEKKLDSTKDFQMEIYEIGRAHV